MRNRDRGWSLVEILIVAAILGFVMAAIFASLHSSTSEYEINNRRAWVLHQARLVVDQMAEELRQATRTSMIPVMAPANAPAETDPPADNISFKMSMPAASNFPPGPGGQPESKFFITYMWMPSGLSDTSQLQPITGATLPQALPAGCSTSIAESTWIDSSGQNIYPKGPTDTANYQKDAHVNGCLVRIDPNPDVYDPANPNKVRATPVKVVCNYLQGEPNMTALKNLAGTRPGLFWEPTGFRVTQSVRAVNGESMLQLHIVLTLQFPNSHPTQPPITEKVETKVFVRNLQ
jgi:type II secretory pathway pseudopilin PulG